MDFSKPPEPWSIEAAPAGGTAMLRIGGRQVPLAEIARLEPAVAADVNIAGHLIAIGLFMALGMLLTVPVAMTLLHPRFLAGGLLFVGVGLMVIQDVLRGHRLLVHKVLIRLRGGGTEQFASPSEAECRALMAAVERHRA